MIAGACKPKPEAQSPSAGAQGDTTTRKREITVFVAASLREAMQDLGKSFEERLKVHVLFNGRTARFLELPFRPGSLESGALGRA